MFTIESAHVYKGELSIKFLTGPTFTSNDREWNTTNASQFIAATFGVSVDWAGTSGLGFSTVAMASTRASIEQRRAAARVSNNARGAGCI